MARCRRFGTLPEAGGFLDQPADLMELFRDYESIEAEADALAEGINTARRKFG